MMEYYNEILNLADISAYHASRHPEATALLFEGKSFDYGCLDRNSDRVCRALSVLERGSRIALLGFDSEKTYELLLGCAKAGQVFTSINPQLEAPIITHILNDSATRLLFVSPELLPKIQPLLQQCPALDKLIVLEGDDAGAYLTYGQWLHGEDKNTHFSSQAVRPEDPVVQIYTSGTSGMPKGVVLSHRAFLAVIADVERAGDYWVDWQPGDVSLLALPSFHIGGLWWAIHGFVNGAANVALKGFTGWRALQLIQEHRINKLAFVPAMLRIMLSEAEISTTDLSSVDTVVYGGSPMPPPILAAAKQVFQCRFAQNYGLSESTNTACYLGPEEHQDLNNPRLKSAGKPLRGVEVKVIDRNGASLPPGEKGEICFRSAATMLAYWKMPEATAAVLVDGWLHTGDIGLVDGEGFVYVYDRLKDMIISAGENIYPVEIERQLLTIPGIAEAAVIGIPDERWGEVPVAILVRRAGADVSEKQVKRFIRENIAGFKQPRSVTFVNDLPRNATGKVLKRILREPYWRGHEKQVG